MQNQKRYNFPSMFCTGKGQSLNSSYYHFLKGWAHCFDGEPIGELTFRTTDIDYEDWIVNITSETPEQVDNDSNPRPHSHSHWRDVTVTSGSIVRTNCLATLDVKEESESNIYVYIDVYSKDSQRVYYFNGSLPGTIGAYDEYCSKHFIHTESKAK